MRSTSRVVRALSFLLAACGSGPPAPAPLPSPAPAPASQVREAVPEIAAATPKAQDVQTPIPPAEAPTEPLQVAVAPAPKSALKEVAAPRSDPWLGDWRCKFDDYPPMRCTVSKRGSGLWLEKTQGSQRIRGGLAQEGDELAFSGEFFCPMGECTSAARATLRKTGGGWTGTLLHDQDGTPMQTALVLTR